MNTSTPFLTHSGEALIERDRDEFDDPIYGPLTDDEAHTLYVSELTEDDRRADYYGRECDR